MFQEREIVHRKHYRPEVQGHVIYATPRRVLVEWDINRPKHHARSSDLIPESLVSDGFYEEPEHLKAVKTEMAPEQRENAIREILNTETWLLRRLAHAGEDGKIPYVIEVASLRQAHLSYLEAQKEAV